MFYIVVAAILLLLFLGGIVTAALSGSGNRAGGATVAGVSLVALLLTTLGFSSTTVDARAIAIQTSFGRYVGTLDNGYHLKAPWSHTEEFSTLINTADLNGGADSVPVTFKGGGSGHVNATVRWRISNSSEGAKLLWSKYRTFEKVNTDLVLRSSKDAILNTANDYLPNDARTKQDEIAGKVKSSLESTLKRYGVQIDSVSILSMPLDHSTQASLDKIVSANNDIARARAEQTRAKIDAETAKIRERTGALSPAANQRYCLDIVNNWLANKNGTLPATFSCDFLDKNTDKTPVIVNSGK